MLQSLHIVNFAIIENTVIDFTKGVTVFTGETGAGKSILLDALSMLIGRRAKTELIRTGSDFFKVEGVFYADDDIIEQLKQDGFEAEDNQIILSRKLNQNGRGMCTINGDFCTVKQLQAIGKQLIRLHEQNDNMELLSIPFCERLVDSGSPEVIEKYESYKKVFAEWKEIRDKLKNFDERKQEQERRLDTLEWELEQISKAGLQLGEDEEIDERLEVLENHEKILRALHSALDVITQDGGLQDNLGSVIQEISTAARYDKELESVEESANSASYTLEDVVSSIESYLAETDFSEDELNNLIERSEVIKDLKRKYGPTIQDVLDYEEKGRKEYEELQDVVYNSDALKTKDKELRKILTEKAADLNDARRASAKNITDKIVLTLRELGMENARMDLHLVDSKEPLPTGASEMEFYFSANTGEPLRSLRDTASGGEISRIALAIELMVAKMIKGQTLIFDEIDVGISGKVAIQVARKIATLSDTMQILCITHLPQTACVADRHYKIEKMVEDGRTQTRAVLLNEEQHYKAIALMLSGTEGSKSALDSVLEMTKQIKSKVNA